MSFQSLLDTILLLCRIITRSDISFSNAVCAFNRFSIPLKGIFHNNIHAVSSSISEAAAKEMYREQIARMSLYFQSLLDTILLLCRIITRSDISFSNAVCAFKYFSCPAHREADSKKTHKKTPGNLPGASLTESYY